MLQSILMGTAAGAVGTVTLNVVTYSDMLIRGRASSTVPATTAGQLTDMAGVPLSSQNGNGGQEQRQRGGAGNGSSGGQEDGGGDETAAHRRTALGALMGYVTGLGIGAVYGARRPRLGNVPMPLAGAALGLAAMVASDVPATAVGATDPRKWGASGWVADIVPHLAYGLLAATAFDAFTAGSRHNGRFRRLIA